MLTARSAPSHFRSLALLGLLALPLAPGAGRAQPAPAPAWSAALGAAAPASMTPAAGWPFESNVASRRAGWSVATAGDVNGDGYSDVIATGNGATSNTFFLFLGGPGGPTLAPGYPLTGLPAGTPVCGAAGDLNGDGYDDVALSFPNSSGGTLRIYYGNASGLNLASPWTNTIVVGAASYAYSVGTAGDLNGDGYADLVVGTPGYAAQIGLCAGSTLNHGRVDVYYGGPSGIPANPNWSLFGCQFLGPYSYLGNSVGTAGDVNGDGYDDIVMGAPGANQAYVFLGGASGLPVYGGGYGDFSARITIAGTTPGDNFGCSVGTAGDVNGDGRADVIVGASNASYYSLTACGEAYVYRGSAAGMDTTVFWTEVGPVGGAHFGSSVGTAGDVNGDGLGDVVVGAPDYASPESGEGLVAVFQSVKTTMISSFFVEGNMTGAYLGLSVATAGDVNGDGFGDVVAGEYGYSNGQTGEGAIQLYYGGGDPPAATPGWAAPGDFASSNYAWSVAGAGDVNGDGYDDYLVGDPTYSDGTASGRGRVFLVYGSPFGPSGWWAGIGGAAGDQLGVSAASAGDINGDGYDDIIVGAHQGGAGVGKALVWYGRSGGLTAGQAADSVVASAAGTQFGGSVAGAGDVNGDGYADVVVGAPADMSTVSGEGGVFLYLGGPGGLSHTVAWSAHGGQQDAHLGSSVAGAGDINGDGYSDLVAGAPDYDKPLSPPFSLLDAGRILWALGGPLGPGAPGYVESGGNWRLGGSVAFAGDVNGDGYSDVVAGATGYQPAISGEGGAFAFAGSSAGLNPNAIWTQAGGEAFAGFGSSVSSAGDIDGDGLSDVLVGAVFMDAGGSRDQGKAFVYRGPLTPGASPAWSAVGGGAYANLGHTVANAGDVNGDGWNDLVFGLPGYNGRQGDARLYYGAGGLGQLRPKLARRALGGVPVPMLGLGGSGGLYFQAIGRSAAGRSKVKLEWRLAPVVGMAGATIAGRQAAFQATGAPSGIGSYNALTQSVAGLTPGTDYAWLIRTLGRSPYFPTSPWVSQARNGRREADVHVPGPALAVDLPTVPGRLALSEARPNPSRGLTAVRFTLSRGGLARLEVIDLQGRRVRLLADGEFAAGPHELPWDGRDDSGAASAVGVYFLRLSAEGEHYTRKVALVH